MTTEPSTAPDMAGAPASPTVRPADVRRLVDALGDLRTAILQARYPLALPSAESALTVTKATAEELGDYLIPRVQRLESPMLVVVGGSTGVGKSTLVNSLVQAPVSPSGVLRPTTRVPVLVHHPDDRSWFTGDGLLPWLPRTPYDPWRRTENHAPDFPEGLQLVATMAISPGIALLDAPDVDSVVDANRSLAGRLLAAADMWLFTTTAARYADAVPWDLLRTARARSIATALVLNRVPGDGREETVDSLTRMLATHDICHLPMFVIPESDRDSQGILSPALLAGLRHWLEEIAASSDVRHAVIRQTVGGAIDQLERTVHTLARAADDQFVTASGLAELAADEYRKADYEITWAIRDGALVRGEVLARWQRLSGSGDLFRIVPTRLGRLPERIGMGRQTARVRRGIGLTRDRAAWTRDRAAVLVGRGGRVTRLQRVLRSDLATLIDSAATQAADRVLVAWRERVNDETSDPLGTTSAPRSTTTIPDEWERAIRERVESQAASEPAGRRIGPHAVTVSTTLVALLACSGVSGKRTSTVAATKTLEAIFGGQEAARLVRTAHDDLTHRIGAFLTAEASRYRDVLAAKGILPANPDEDQSDSEDHSTLGDQLRSLAREATIARLCAGLPAAHTAPAQLPSTHSSTMGTTP